jgi:ABC-type transport system involved in cytochrome bd biosynthesis fused ATPase/permease subunit
MPPNSGWLSIYSHFSPPEALTRADRGALLLHDPRWIVLDEPSARRDPGSERQIVAPLSMLAHEAEGASR